MTLIIFKFDIIHEQRKRFQATKWKLYWIVWNVAEKRNNEKLFFIYKNLILMLVLMKFSQEIDLNYNGERIEIDPDTFSVSRPVNELSYNIISWSDDEKEELLDLTSSFLVFDRPTTFILSISISLFILLLKLISKRETRIFGYFGSFFAQDFSRLFHKKMKCLFTLLWLIFTFFTFHHW